MKRPRRFETRAVHSGEHRAGAEEGRDGIFYPISTPIYASTTFSHPNIETTDRVLGGEEQGYSYARYDNPTVRAFEEALVSLEAPEAKAGIRAFAFASGMAATHAALMAAELKVAELKPRAIVVESISNPLLRVADIPEISKITRAAGAALIVDNTFGTPYLQQPLELGADIVVHSATKYLSGHGDITAGVVVAGPPYAAAVEQPRKLVRGVLAPFEAWLAHRGLKTLPLRMGRQCENARRIASSLAVHPKVAKVNHPSLRAHPDHQTAGRVLSDTGGLVSFELAPLDREAAYAFLDALELCVKAPSLGDIYTLAIHPATSSHRELSPSRRERLGVGENLVRLSVGIEHAGDVISDLEQALERL